MYVEPEENQYRQPYLQSKDRDTDTENKHVYRGRRRGDELRD